MPPLPPMPIGPTATGDVEAPVVTRGWYMPEIFPPSYEDHLRRLSLKGSFAPSWVSSLDAEQLLVIERDLISKLHVPKVIEPNPTRSKRTVIYIDCNNIIDSTNWLVEMAASKKTPREVEVELELPDALPAIVSSCNKTRVHLTNDAYKKMVGQPLCSWLDFLLGPGHHGGSTVSWQHEDTTASLIVPCGVEHLTGNSDYSFI
uniref:Uncharacterized protein n=1 Tax=Setaria viridis TaxID=4556 RepID=A0A4V6D686_SETVI|nr:hypothetical protein SEVIR_5G098300v2 [Setaria viridis]